MILEVKDLSFSYHRHAVLSDISFSADEGEFLSVLGANGVGKSTMFRCILGLMKDYSGTIRIGGTDIRTMTQRELASNIAYIPQTRTTPFDFTVLETVLMGTARQLPPFSAPGSKQIRAAEDALARLDIAEFADRSFARLSGGEQQLVMIARALAQQARILLMDEPTSNLDYGNQLRVLSHVRELANDGYTVLLSTHNPQHALTYSSSLLALAGGTIAAFGSPKDVLSAELIKTLYHIDAEFITFGGQSILLPELPLKSSKETDK